MTSLVQTNLQYFSKFIDKILAVLSIFTKVLNICLDGYHDI